jgi:hypothetical protein
VTQVSTEKYIDLLIISESKRSIYDTSFIWKALKSNLVKKDKAIIFIWLATCDLTTKTGKYIELTHTSPRQMLNILFVILICDISFDVNLYSGDL